MAGYRLIVMVIVIVYYKLYIIANYWYYRIIHRGYLYNLSQIHNLLYICKHKFQVTTYQVDIYLQE